MNIVKMYKFQYRSNLAHIGMEKCVSVCDTKFWNLAFLYKIHPPQNQILRTFHVIEILIQGHPEALGYGPGLAMGALVVPLIKKFENCIFVWKRPLLKSNYTHFFVMQLCY